MELYYVELLLSARVNYASNTLGMLATYEPFGLSTPTRSYAVLTSR